MDGEREAARKPARVFDVEAIRRVPGGIASHRVTQVVLGPARPSPGADVRR